jgi:very-short-patch-repair endonuclease
VGGVKFRRQHAIGPFIADFYCVSARLVIEVDGPNHTRQRAADEERQAYLEGLGLAVLRFSNEDVLGRMAAVLARIARIVESRISPLSSQGEGVGGKVTPHAH